MRSKKLIHVEGCPYTRLYDVTAPVQKFLGFHPLEVRRCRNCFAKVLRGDPELHPPIVPVHEPRKDEHEFIAALEKVLLTQPGPGGLQ